MKLRKNDTVAIVSGKDKGKTGKVEKLFSKEAKVLVTGVNQYKRHVKARAQGSKSEIITITKPLPVSNVSFICPSCKKQTRIGYELGKKEKTRICRNCKNKI